MKFKISPTNRSLQVLIEKLSIEKRGKNPVPFPPVLLGKVFESWSVTFYDFPASFCGAISSFLCGAHYGLPIYHNWFSLFPPFLSTSTCQLSLEAHSHNTGFCWHDLFTRWFLRQCVAGGNGWPWQMDLCWTGNTLQPVCIWGIFMLRELNLVQIEHKVHLKKGPCFFCLSALNWCVLRMPPGNICAEVGKVVCFLDPHALSTKWWNGFSHTLLQFWISAFHFVTDNGPGNKRIWQQVKLMPPGLS